jgi:hypothetical protein
MGIGDARAAKANEVLASAVAGAVLSTIATIVQMALVLAKITPFSPNWSRSAAQATRMIERVNANMNAVERLNA